MDAATNRFASLLTALPIPVLNEPGIGVALLAAAVVLGGVAFGALWFHTSMAAQGAKASSGGAPLVRWLRVAQSMLLLLPLTVVLLLVSYVSDFAPCERAVHGCTWSGTHVEGYIFVLYSTLASTLFGAIVNSRQNRYAAQNRGQRRSHYVAKTGVERREDMARHDFLLDAAAIGLLLCAVTLAFPFTLDKL